MLRGNLSRQNPQLSCSRWFSSCELQSKDCRAESSRYQLGQCHNNILVTKMLSHLIKIHIRYDNNADQPVTTIWRYFRLACDSIATTQTDMPTATASIFYSVIERLISTSRPTDDNVFNENVLILTEFLLEVLWMLYITDWGGVTHICVT